MSIIIHLIATDKFHSSCAIIGTVLLAWINALKMLNSTQISKDSFPRTEITPFRVTDCSCKNGKKYPISLFHCFHRKTPD